MKNCPKCKKENNENAKFCSYCGEKFEEVEKKAAKFCPKCGEKLVEGTQVCSKCGFDAEHKVFTKKVDKEKANKKDTEIIKLTELYFMGLIYIILAILSISLPFANWFSLGHNSSIIGLSNLISRGTYGELINGIFILTIIVQVLFIINGVVMLGKGVTSLFKKENIKFVDFQIFTYVFLIVVSFGISGAVGVAPAALLAFLFIYTFLKYAFVLVLHQEGLAYKIIRSIAAFLIFISLITFLNTSLVSYYNGGVPYLNTFNDGIYPYFCMSSNVAVLCFVFYGVSLIGLFASTVYGVYTKDYKVSYILLFISGAVMLGLVIGINCSNEEFIRLPFVGGYVGTLVMFLIAGVLYFVCDLFKQREKKKLEEKETPKEVKVEE